MAPPALLRSAAVIRFRVFLGTLLALGAIVTTLVRAQLSDDEKKETGRPSQGARGNARGRFSRAHGNAGANGQTETGPAQGQIEENIQGEIDPDTPAQKESDAGTG